MPGIGKKTAQRLAYFVLHREEGYAFEFAAALRELKENLQWCQRCYNVSEREICEICAIEGRRTSVLCVVEDAVNVANIERSGSFDGYYHVLQGYCLLSTGLVPPIFGSRNCSNVWNETMMNEVIIATNPTVEGEATAVYLADALADTEIVVSPNCGGHSHWRQLDYCDEITMAKAIENRRLLS